MYDFINLVLVPLNKIHVKLMSSLVLQWRRKYCRFKPLSMEYDAEMWTSFSLGLQL